jgi:hypothetical protein
MPSAYRSVVRFVFAVVVTCFVGDYVVAAEFTVKQSDRGVTVNLDGKLFTEYLIASGPRPYLWPIIGPTGEPMTRAFPMKDIEGEVKDHYHHRSLWFAHREVNGVDFWAEPESFKAGKIKPDHVFGKIVHREFKKVGADGKTASLTAVNDWIDANGKKHCEDERTVTFRTSGDKRIIDFDIVVRAVDIPVTFGDDKDGTLAVRVASSMDVKGGDGHFVNAEGMKDEKEAWGKPSRWVDYYGPVKDQIVGIAILNHPSSLRHPTPWHVRDYGLFGSNPFGLAQFDPKAGKSGELTIKPGESFTMKHRIIFHAGDAASADIAGAYEEYAR